MTDAVLSAMIGVVGSVIGAIATILAAHIQAAHKAAHKVATEGPGKEQVFGDTVDFRELRILRALYSGLKGRPLDEYKDYFYRLSFAAVIRKEWVEKDNRNYRMTPEGAEFCREYFKELLKSWTPPRRSQ